MDEIMNEMLENAVLIFREYLEGSKIKWNEAFFRYSQTEDNATVSMSYLEKKTLYMPDQFLSGDRHIEGLKALFSEFFQRVGEQSQRPVVCVMQVCEDGTYNLKFGKSEDDFSIRLIHLGKKNSYFKGRKIKSSIG